MTNDNHVQIITHIDYLFINQSLCSGSAHIEITCSSTNHCVPRFSTHIDYLFINEPLCSQVQHTQRLLVHQRTIVFMFSTHIDYLFINKPLCSGSTLIQITCSSTNHSENYSNSNLFSIMAVRYFLPFRNKIGKY